MKSRRVVLNVGVADGAEVGRVELVGTTVGSTVVFASIGWQGGWLCTVAGSTRRRHRGDKRSVGQWTQMATPYCP
jgi:hypothetical protein